MLKLKFLNLQNGSKSHKGTVSNTQYSAFDIFSRYHPVNKIDSWVNFLKLRIIENQEINRNEWKAKKIDSKSRKNVEKYMKIKLLEYNHRKVWGKSGKHR